MLFKHNTILCKVIQFLKYSGSTYYDAVHNNISDKIISNHLFGWFYISCK